MSTNADISISVGHDGPGKGSETAIQSDTEDLPVPYRSLYATTAGDVKFVGWDGIEDTWSVPANYIIPLVIKRVFSTGTTAGGLKGIF